MDIEIGSEAVAHAPSASQIPGKLAKERRIVPAGLIGPPADDARFQRRGGSDELQPATQNLPGRRPDIQRNGEAGAGVVRIRIPATPVQGVGVIETGRKWGSRGVPYGLAGLRHRSGEGEVD